MSRLRPVSRALLAELRVALMTVLQYRASFWGEAVMAVVNLAWVLAPLLVVFRYTPGLSGWTEDEALLVMGSFIVLEGLMNCLIEPNLRAVVQQVRDGTFDFVLLKPLDAQLQVSVHRTNPIKLPHALVGLGLLIHAARRLPEPPGLADVALSALLLTGGLLILHAIFTMVAATSFWFVRVDNLSYLLHSALEVGRWPVAFYKGAVRWLLTFVLPVGIMTTWPAMALRGQLGPGEAALGLGVAVAFVLLGRATWSLALRHYSSASS